MNSVDISNFIIERLAMLKQIPAETIEANSHVFHVGLDSSGALELTCYIEDYLGISLDASIIWEYPVIDDLSEHLASNYAPAEP
ncbi:MAG: acyl carrier protein [Cyanobium sp.]|jgi:acyl carrier protein